MPSLMIIGIIDISNNRVDVILIATFYKVIRALVNINATRPVTGTG